MPQLPGTDQPLFLRPEILLWKGPHPVAHTVPRAQVGRDEDVDALAGDSGMPETAA